MVGSNLIMHQIDAENFNKIKPPHISNQLPEYTFHVSLRAVTRSQYGNQ